jgi:hypothetical protein
VEKAIRFSNLDIMDYSQSAEDTNIGSAIIAMARLINFDSKLGRCTPNVSIWAEEIDHHREWKIMWI